VYPGVYYKREEKPMPSPKRVPVTKDENFGNAVAELMDTLEAVGKKSQSLPDELLDEVHERVEDLTILIQKALVHEGVRVQYRSGPTEPGD
jgi:ElaB/YqjD/DUF883 family membrane-anchored ribosome-binding protein